MVTDATVFKIRDIKEISELRAVEDLQKEIWGCTEREILPSLTLIPLLEVGGVLLGAFAGEELIGFSLGFPGLEQGRPILHSDMLGVITTEKRPAFFTPPGQIGYGSRGIWKPSESGTDSKTPRVTSRRNSSIFRDWSASATTIRRYPKST